MFRLAKCEYILLIVAALCAIVSITTWIVFPIVFPKAVASHMALSQNNDGSLGYSSFLWSHPPMNNVMRFYFFNVTNPDEVIYSAAKPLLNEVGPFSFIESEQKKYMNWSDDGNQVFYENYKRYVFTREHSCSTCSFDDLVTIPNPPQIGATSAMSDPQYGVTPMGKLIIASGLLLLGEYPFVTQKAGEILFTGYNDALLSAAHSHLVTFLSGILNGGKSIIPIPVPAMPRMGFFQGYNNTQDEYYWIKTGKDGADNLGKVVTWANVSELPREWWSTPYARQIRGSDSGTFSKMQLTKDDVIPNFQSFQCRSFDNTFLEETTVHNIPAYTFSAAYDQYDTTANQNIGFRYRNVERVNYYPDWPECPKRNASNCVTSKKPNCSLQENLCDDCCDGSLVNGTYLLPPGMFPLVCYPGRMDVAPFTVIYSPPHFLYSPSQVVDSVGGMHPDPNKHRPMLYTREPFSGTIVEVKYQLMVSMPMMKSTYVTQSMHVADSVVPLFWQGATATLHEDTYHTLWLGFVLVPKLVDAIKYFLLAVALILLALTVVCAIRRTKQRSSVAASISESF